MLNSKSRRPSSARSRMTIRGSGATKTKAPMARANKIPAGRYRSTIISIKEVKTVAGDEAVEITYDLVSPDGQHRQMREVIPFDTWPYAQFCTALIYAGLNDGDDLLSAVGIVEDVVIEYPDPNGLGHFSERYPVSDLSDSDGAGCEAFPSTAKPHKSEFEDDGEFDDFLEEDDE